MSPRKSEMLAALAFLALILLGLTCILVPSALGLHAIWGLITR